MRELLLKAFAEVVLAEHGRVRNSGLGIDRRSSIVGLNPSPGLLETPGPPAIGGLPNREDIS
jgi:hypothetical protein